MPPLSHLMKDVVTLVKQDGRRIEKIKAMVQSGQIFIEDGRLPLEDGDYLERERLGGITESFEVLAGGFINAVSAMPAHFQAKVRKATPRVQEILPPHMLQRPQVVYHITGNNNRVNNQSTDASTNVVNIETTTLFTKIRQTAEAIEDEATRIRVVDTVDAMEAANGTPSMMSKYNDFVASAANHMTAFAPFLPALAELLTKVIR
jgi:hypothetical protein